MFPERSSVRAALLCATCCLFAGRVHADTLATASLAVNGVSLCSQSSASSSDCGNASASAGYLGVSSSVGADGSPSFSIVTDAFAEAEDQLTFSGGTGAGQAFFTFLVNIGLTGISSGAGTHSITCIFGTCFEAQQDFVPPPFGGNFSSNGPTLYTVEVPFQFGQSFAINFSSQSRALSANSDDSSGAGSSVTLVELNVINPEGQNVPFVVTSAAGVNYANVPEPSSFGLTILALGLAVLRKHPK
jgi:hypothetical protein